MNGKKVADTVVNVLLVIFGIILVVSAQGIDVGTALGQGGDFMPKVCGAAWLVISVLLLGFNIKADIPPRETPINLKNFLVTLVMLIVYGAALSSVGFVICSIVYLFLQMMIFVPKEKKTNKNIAIFAVISVVTPVVIDLLFANVFSLILPQGILG